MIVYDFEVLKHDWLMVYLDTNTRKLNVIINDKKEFERFYDKYKEQIWIGYNSRGYDQWVAKAILCDFNAYDMNDWIINKERHGFEFSNLLNKFPIYNYDTSVGFKSLKELEASMGHDIRETTIPFDIDRKLTPDEIKEMVTYCEHDVMETFHVFVNTKHEFESHVGLLKEFKLDLSYISKTKAQLSAIILNANRKHGRDDEFDITFPDTMELGEYKWLENYYTNWSTHDKDYKKLKLSTTINGLAHEFGIGGLHGARKHYIGSGHYLMLDVESYYPALMIEYEFLSRNVSRPDDYRHIRDMRLELKALEDKRQAPMKIVLNSTFGASKDRFNNLYDPLQSNNTCIGGQLLLTDLLDKLNGKCILIQSNTDGLLVELYNKNDKQMIVDICEKWCLRTRLKLSYDEYVKVIQKDVNNYILIDSKGHLKQKGSYAKKPTTLDNDLPIVRKAFVQYFVYGIPVETTINNCNDLIDFQKISKSGRQYLYTFKENQRGEFTKYSKLKKTKGTYVNIDDSKYGKKLSTRVNRCFASKLAQHGGLYKHKKGKTSLDKVGGTPDKCFVINGNILDMDVPFYLDKQWYIDLTNERIKDYKGRRK